MSIIKEEVIQSVTISGVILTTASGVVNKGSKAETALKTLRDECEKQEQGERAYKISVVLIEEFETPGYGPNIDYLWGRLRNKSNGMYQMNFLLGLALSNVRPPKNFPDVAYYTAEGFLTFMEDIVNS